MNIKTYREVNVDVILRAPISTLSRIVSKNQVRVNTEIIHNEVLHNTYKREVDAAITAAKRCDHYLWYGHKYIWPQSRKKVGTGLTTTES